MSDHHQQQQQQTLVDRWSAHERRAGSSVVEGFPKTSRHNNNKNESSCASSPSIPSKRYFVHTRERYESDSGDVGRRRHVGLLRDRHHHAAAAASAAAGAAAVSAAVNGILYHHHRHQHHHHHQENNNNASRMITTTAMHSNRSDDDDDDDFCSGTSSGDNMKSFHQYYSGSLPAVAGSRLSVYYCHFWTEFLSSADLLFQNRLTWFLLLGPVAVVGDATGVLGEAICFCFSGIALIPCAERLSFVTEQIATHTNGTIGALLNATFGNAPELLISVAALRAGFYRVVQLAMLGSMLTNMILVFGVACVIGGLRWQVQELRIVTGNVSVVLLLVATAGTLFPAVLFWSLSQQRRQQQQWNEGGGWNSGGGSANGGAVIASASAAANVLVPTAEEVTFCRINAAVMFALYLLYLLFQLGTHKDEFDDEHAGHVFKRRARRNALCLRVLEQAKKRGSSGAAAVAVAATTGRASVWRKKKKQSRRRAAGAAAEATAADGAGGIGGSRHCKVDTEYETLRSEESTDLEEDDIDDDDDDDGGDDDSDMDSFCEEDPNRVRRHRHGDRPQVGGVGVGSSGGSISDCSGSQVPLIRRDSNTGGGFARVENVGTLSSTDEDDDYEDDDYHDDDEDDDDDDDGWISAEEAGCAHGDAEAIAARRRRRGGGGGGSSHRRRHDLCHLRQNSSNSKYRKEKEMALSLPCFTATSSSSPPSPSPRASPSGRSRRKLPRRSLSDHDVGLGLGLGGGGGVAETIRAIAATATTAASSSTEPMEESADSGSGRSRSGGSSGSGGSCSALNKNGNNNAGAALLSLRVGIVWLFVITVCISAMSDILVDTIDGFARRMRVSETFTSMVILPFFSNVAEQVSAFLFAYRNEMDLTVGVTVGSAVQIATFVLPGSVLIGMLMDRSMTLLFQPYETASLFFAVVTVGAILQGGTTNWLTGAMLVGIYIIFAAGVWFHEIEDLSVDAEILIRNATAAAAASVATAATATASLTATGGSS